MKETIKFAGDEFKSYKAAFECAKDCVASTYSSLFQSVEPSIRLALKAIKRAKTEQALFEAEQKFFVAFSIMEKMANAYKGIDPSLASCAKDVCAEWVEEYDQILKTKNF